MPDDAPSPDHDSSRDPVGDAEAGRRRELPWALAITVVALAFAAYHIHQLRFFCDDSYISFRYARNFAEGHGLVYNLGERVEGYTNFLWVVLLALGMKIGLGVEVWSLALGLALLVLTGALTARLTHRLTGSTVSAALSALLLASLGPLILWASSGLETICFAAAALGALSVYDRSMERPRGLFVAGLLYAASTMVRPDGAIFGAVAGLHLCVFGLASRVPVPALLRRGAALLAGYLVLLGPFLLWRYSYYQDWFPNTFYVKTGSSTQWRMGTEYLANFARDYWLLWSLMLAGLCVGLLAPSQSRHRHTHTHLALAIGGFAFYIAKAGGDYMTLYRFSVPILGPAVVLAAVALWAALHRIPGLPRPAVWSAGGLAGLAFALICWGPTRDSLEGRAPSDLLNTQQMMKINTDRWSAAGRTLKGVLWPDARIATTAAGALPFFAEAWTLDQSGLCDRHTAKVDWDPWILHKPGHQKQATRAYLTSLEPPVDIVFHHPVLGSADPRAYIPPPDRDQYVTRALRIEGLEDENGQPQYLYFALHVGRLQEAQRAGMVDPDVFPTPPPPQ